MIKQLTPKNVGFLVVHPTKSTVHQDLSIDDILKSRRDEGYSDIGFHYVITRDGLAYLGIPSNEAGTHTAQYDDISVGILLVGGKSTRGKPSDNYTPIQKSTLKLLIKHLQILYPIAKPVGVGELWGGSSPHFSVQELLNESN